MHVCAVHHSRTDTKIRAKTHTCTAQTRRHTDIKVFGTVIYAPIHIELRTDAGSKFRVGFKLVNGLVHRKQDGRKHHLDHLAHRTCDKNDDEGD